MWWTSQEAAVVSSGLKSEAAAGVMLAACVDLSFYYHTRSEADVRLSSGFNGHQWKLPRVVILVMKVAGAKLTQKVYTYCSNCYAHYRCFCLYVFACAYLIFFCKPIEDSFGNVADSNAANGGDWRADTGLPFDKVDQCDCERRQQCYLSQNNLKKLGLKKYKTSSKYVCVYAYDVFGQERKTRKNWKQTTIVVAPIKAKRMDNIQLFAQDTSLARFTCWEAATIDCRLPCKHP